jgi:hypothetical protein
MALSGCLGDEESSMRGNEDQPAKASAAPPTQPSQERLARLGLTFGPPANLVAACRRVARTSTLTVYCPPIVPKGSVEAPKRRSENAYVFGDESGYGLSLQSQSLIDSETSDALAAKHWVVAARAPARGLVKTVDESVRYPRAEFKSRPRHFTVGGVRATLVTGDLVGSGFAGSGHAIAYWRIGDIFYEASVHFDDKARLAEEIARGLIDQMVSCAGSSTVREAKICEWVFSAAP